MTMQLKTRAQMVRNKPQRTRSAYNYFFQDIKSAEQEDFFTRTGKKPSYTVLAKLIAARWKKVSPEEKTYYETLAAKDKRRFALEVIDWKMQKGSCEQDSVSQETTETHSIESPYRVSKDTVYEPLSLKLLLPSPPSTQSLSPFAGFQLPKRERLSTSPPPVSSLYSGGQIDVTTESPGQSYDESSVSTIRRTPHVVIEDTSDIALFDDNELSFLTDFGIRGYDLFSPDVHLFFS